MKEKEVLTEEDLKKIEEIFSLFEKKFLEDFDVGLKNLEANIDNLKTNMDRLASSIDNLKANMDSLEKSLDEANRWASLAQEAAEIEVIKTPSTKTGPKEKNKEEKGKLWWWLLIS